MSDLSPCATQIEVEAREDGRLGPLEVSRLERHLAACAACRAHRDALRALREAGRGLPAADPSPLELRRLRARILRAAAVGPAPSARWAVPLAAAAVFLALPTYGILRWASAPEALSEVVPQGPARWSRRVTRALEAVELREGAHAVQVPRQHRGHRFQVHLPDGTLEVRGTAFVVEVRRGVTVAVRVTEGMVWLDLQGLGARTLAAGATWSRVPAAADLARPSPPPAPPEPAPPTAQASTATSTPSPSASAPPTAARSGTVATTAARHAPTAFLDYAAGVRAMARGDYRAAAESFARFEQRARQDERAADAGWLRVVALRRAGDAPGARQAAAQYLRAYPEGAHRDAARRALGE